MFKASSRITIRKNKERSHLISLGKSVDESDLSPERQKGDKRVDLFTYYDMIV